MHTDESDVAVQPGRPILPNDRNRSLRQWWSAITILLAVAVFMEAIFAGAMLSGVDWARTAHSANAAILIASTICAGFVSVVTLRRAPHGLQLGLTLLSLGVVLFFQAAIGAFTAKGSNLLWVHVPLGVFLFGFAVLAVLGARRLRGNEV
jgi:hypothetical protein